MSHQEYSKVTHPSLLDMRSYIHQGNLLYEQGCFAEAMVNFKKALHLDPNFFPTRYNLANCYAKQNQMEKAIIHYQRVIDICPDYFNAHLNASLAYMALRQFEKAQVLLEKALVLDPVSADALRYLARVYVSLRKNDEAMDCLLKLIHQCPDLAEAHYNLAIVYLRKKNRVQAAAHFKITLALNPNNETAQHMTCALNSDENGPSPHTAPLGYVIRLFDQYAPRFNQHVQETLHYR